MISIIILTFNSMKYIKSCLDSVFSQDFSDFELILVDNGSEDGTLSFIKENYSQVILIENKKNLGACKARNQGIEIAKGEWILTLDCDIVLENNFLSFAVRKIKNLHEDVGIIQSNILMMDRKTIYSNGIFLSSMKRFYDIGKGQKYSGKFDNSKYIFGACAAAAFYRKKMLEVIKEETGYFDERFFFLVEDVDLSWRAKKKGWHTVFFSKAICYHSSNSSNFDKKFRQYLCFRNRRILLEKNDDKKMYLLRSLSYEIPRLFYLFFLNRNALMVLKEKNRQFECLSVLPKRNI